MSEFIGVPDAQEVCSYACMAFGSRQLQLYVMPSWFGVSRTSVVSQMDCAFTDFQEPSLHFLVLRCRYVILKYTPSTPMYDERFVNYGYNKLQLIEHLRSANYHFFLLNHAFMTDLAHEE